MIEPSQQAGGARTLRSRRGVVSLAAAAVCVAAVAVGVALVVRDGGPSGTRSTRAAPLPSPVTSVATPTPTASTATTTSTGPAPIQAVSLARSSLAIPALHVRAAIVSAPVVQGVLEPPRDPAQVGVWGGSAGLGAGTGMVTLAGHVNWAGMAPFAFARLATLHPGARVYTSDADGAEHGWRVTSVSSRKKETGIDVAAFAGSAGPRTLVLITCGGTYDSGARSYQDNVYVYATPVPVRARST